MLKYFINKCTHIAFWVSKRKMNVYGSTSSPNVDSNKIMLLGV